MMNSMKKKILQALSMSSKMSFGVMSVNICISARRSSLVIFRELSEACTYTDPKNGSVSMTKTVMDTSTMKNDKMAKA